MRRSLAESLDRLGLDRVDVVYLHDPDHAVEQAIDETIPALIALRDEGVAQAIGVAVAAAAPFNSGILARPWPPDGARYN